MASVDEIEVNVPEAAAAATSSETKREGGRLTQGAAHTLCGVGKIGGEFTLTKDPAFIARRIDMYDQIMAEQEATVAAMPRNPISITLPDGTIKEGTSWETTPLDIANSISAGLAQRMVVAEVCHTGERFGSGLEIVNTGPEQEEAPAAEAKGELWDLTRPLEGDCTLSLKSFNDPEGKMVFWHSSAHILGECLECEYGAKLYVGPPVADGFYYDAYMGEETFSESQYKAVDKKAAWIAKKKQPFQRIVLSKQQALDMFADNPFKVAIISTKIPDGGRTTAYRCGPLIDLCMGPHVPHTGKVKSFAVMNNSSSYYLAKAENDTFQRVYGVSFPDKKQMKEHKQLLAEAKKRDHRRLGQEQELFFFHPLSPGSAFFLPHGTRIYNRLQDFIKQQYRTRGYQEVVTPNLFNMKLWEISGHAKHYRDDMFLMDCDGTEFGLKPMNCPGHCLLFANRLRSYRELPLRIADFGVLHRNELSGALTGLTRVRRFQQDDAHIFCREDQIKEEVLGALDFMQHTYGLFGMRFELELSTRPTKAVGADTPEGLARWNNAEASLQEALNSFAGEGNWRVNPGDGAFYGPKIDIKVFDALKRQHQCATVQLDFQLPRRFDLNYRSAVGTEAKTAEGGAAGASETEAAAGSGETFSHPVMIHRAILGSLERMIAVLTEHFGGKWPFWLSPRQVLVVPVSRDQAEYAEGVRQQLHDQGYFVDVNVSNKTLNKKIREGQLAQYNFILVVGGNEASNGTVNVRTRNNERQGEKSLEEINALFAQLMATHQ